MSSLGNDFHVAWHEQEEKLYRLTCNYFWMQRKGSKDRVQRFIKSDCSNQRSRIKVEEPGLTTLRRILKDKDIQWRAEDEARRVISMVTKIQARFRGYRARKVVDPQHYLLQIASRKNIDAAVHVPAVAPTALVMCW